MKWPTMDEFAQMVADKAIDEVEYNGKTIREWTEIISNTELGTNLAEVGTDCISRQAAIDAIGEKSDEIYKTKQKGATYPHDDFFQGMAYAEDVVKRLPPIQPKRGKWIYCEDSMADCVDGYRCDQCGFFIPWDYQHKGIDYIKDYNFCPHCGSYNGGKNEI